MSVFHSVNREKESSIGSTFHLFSIGCENFLLPEKHVSTKMCLRMHFTRSYYHCDLLNGQNITGKGTAVGQCLFEWVQWIQVSQDIVPRITWSAFPAENVKIKFTESGPLKVVSGNLIYLQGIHKSTEI